MRSLLDPKADQKEIIVQIDDITLTRAEFSCLRPRGWLSSDVISAYMKLLDERAKLQIRPKCKFMSTYFYTMLTSGADGYDFQGGLGHVKGIDILGYERIIIPCYQHAREHWVLVMMDLISLSLEYLDPLVENVPQDALSVELQVVGMFFEDLAKVRSQNHIKPTLWRQMIRRDIPVQKDHCNCGVYVIGYANFLGLDLEIEIDPKRLPLMRKRIAVDLKTQKVSNF